MNYVLIGLGIALALSMAGNATLTHFYLEQRDTAKQAVSDRDSARGAAKQCSDGVASLQAAAEARAAGAEQRRKDAETVALLAEGRAQALLQKRPSVPDDDCRSAAVQMDDWLSTRKPK
jgi:hypothetical protein